MLDDLCEYEKEIKAKTRYAFRQCVGSLIRLKIKDSFIYFKKIKGYLFLHKKNKARNNYEKHTIVVYTALYGPYDNIKPIYVKNSNVTYYAFTDQYVPPHSGWIKQDYTFPEDVGDDNVLKNRYLRMHPYILFPEYDYAIYIDSSYILKHDITYLIKRIDKSPVALYKHPWAKDIYDETDLVIRWNRAPKNLVLKQLEKYKQEGYPKKFGMSTNSIIVSRIDSDDVKNIFEQWWVEFKKEENTKRDQMCLYYILWKLGYPKNYFAKLGDSVYDDPIVEQHVWFKY